MNIRDAKTEDSTVLQSLLVQLGYEMTIKQVQDKISAYNVKDSHIVWVAEDSSKIIGFITFILYECFVINGGCMHVESIVIDKEYRGKGVGHKLIDAAEKYALAKGCSISELITFNHRRKDRTHDFYAKLGYDDNVKTEITYFSKEL